LPAHWLAVAHWTHRWLGVLLLGLFIHLGIAGRGTPLARATSTAALLAVVQVGLGIATVLLRLEPPIRAAHAAVGYALWGAVVWTAASSGALSLLTAPRRAAKRMAEARLA
jgi:heme A synthase